MPCLNFSLSTQYPSLSSTLGSSLSAAISDAPDGGTATVVNKFLENNFCVLPPPLPSVVYLSSLCGVQKWDTSDAPFPCYSVNDKVGITRHLHKELRSGVCRFKASVFGELWKLEPLGDKRKRKWRTKMDWLLSPTNHMIELVPVRQSGSNGQRLEQNLGQTSI